MKHPTVPLRRPPPPPFHVCLFLLAFSKNVLQNISDFVANAMQKINNLSDKIYQPPPFSESNSVIFVITRAPRGTDRSPEYNEPLLLKVRFLSKSESMTAILNSKQSRYFNSGYEDAFSLLLLHSDLKKKSFGQRTPH